MATGLGTSRRALESFHRSERELAGLSGKPESLWVRPCRFSRCASETVRPERLQFEL